MGEKSDELFNLSSNADNLVARNFGLRTKIPLNEVKKSCEIRSEVILHGMALFPADSRRKNGHGFKFERPSTRRQLRYHRSVNAHNLSGDGKLCIILSQFYPADPLYISRRRHLFRAEKPS